jgi:cytochrome b
MFLGSKVRPVYEADKFTAIYEPMVQASLTSHNPIGPVTTIALLFLLLRVLRKGVQTIHRSRC